jgi:hypothetical protein
MVPGIVIFVVYSTMELRGIYIYIYIYREREREREGFSNFQLHIKEVFFFPTSISANSSPV